MEGVLSSDVTPAGRFGEDRSPKRCEFCDSGKPMVLCTCTPVISDETREKLEALYGIKFSDWKPER